MRGEQAESSTVTREEEEEVVAEEGNRVMSIITGVNNKALEHTNRHINVLIQQRLGLILSQCMDSSQSTSPPGSVS